MTEIEQLRADLATLEKAKKIDVTPATLHRLNQEIDYIEKHIADLEVQQEQADEWAGVKAIIADWINHPYNTHIQGISLNKLAVYVHHLESKVAELTTILNDIPPACGLNALRTLYDYYGKQFIYDVLDDIENYDDHNNDGGKVRADRKAISAEQNRENLAELTTILNAIPAACGLARELVEKRVEEVKKEMQG